MRTLGRISHIARRHWGDRAHYATAGGWLLSIYNRTMIHAPLLHLPGRHRVKSVHLTTTPEPLLVRLGTSDWYAMEEVFLYGEYAPIARDVRAAGTILDFGANVGMSIRFWRMTYPGARVVAVEPDPGNLAMARRNAAGDANVTLLHACVAARPRTVVLDRRSGSEYAFRMTEAGDQARGADAVDALTVPQVLERGGITGEVDLLKCDIEGAEAELFADCADWIGRVRALAVEVHDPYTVERLQDDLRRAGADLRLFDRHSKGGFETAFFNRSDRGTSTATPEDPTRATEIHSSSSSPRR